MTLLPLELKPAMAKVFRDPARHRLVLAGRRTGKSFLSMAELLRTAIQQPGSRGIYLAPTLLMSRGILWDLLKQHTPAGWIAGKNEVAMVMKFTNGSQIKCGGLEHSDALRGLSANLLVLDEFAYASGLQKSWQGALYPTLSTTRGRSLWISTPAGSDPWTRQHCETAETYDDWSIYKFHSTQGGWIPPEEIEIARRSLDLALFRQEYCADWVSLVGAIFPQFSDANIARVHDRQGDILVGLDFNVSPFCAVIAQVNTCNDVEILREVILNDADTDQMASALLALYPGRNIKVCPDPTGARRQTSSMGLSDHTILKNRGLKVVSPTRPWQVRDKVTAVRFFIRTADGQRRLRIDPSCERLIQSLRALEFWEGRSVPSPRDPHGHAVDALAYLLMCLRGQLIPYGGISEFRIW